MKEKKQRFDTLTNEDILTLHNANDMESGLLIYLDKKGKFEIRPFRLTMLEKEK